MPDSTLPAVFMRGGTSKAIMFHARDLPSDRGGWDPIFLAAMGSPDPNGRQLNGMGGGLSSVSKVCIVGEASRSDADVDYTFAQVRIGEAFVDYSGNCGNMSSAIGPFAVDEGLISADGSEVTVRIHNTNTKKVIWSTFPIADGKASSTGDLEIPGVAGTGAPIRLDFLDPGGASTGKLLPTGQVAQFLDVEGLGRIEVSMIDAANACVFVAAGSIGLTGTELPADLDADQATLDKLAKIRAAASVAMGITPSLDAPGRSIPFIAIVSPPQSSDSLTGSPIAAADADLTVRAISSGQPHRALPLTVSLCTAVAAKLTGSVVNRNCAAAEGQALRLAMPSGVLNVGATVSHQDGRWSAERGMFYRTARRLFEGSVCF